MWLSSGYFLCSVTLGRIKLSCAIWGLGIVYPESVWMLGSNSHVCQAVRLQKASFLVA